MIELLKSKRVDTALLCELATHPDFSKLLADIQIYVEGIASMQIQNLNAWVDVASFEGSRAEQLLMVFWKQTKLRYNKLTEDEKQALIRIMQKSELMKSPVSQRGRKK